MIITYLCLLMWRQRNAEIEEIVRRENELREAIRNIIAEIEVGDE